MKIINALSISIATILLMPSVASAQKCYGGDTRELAALGEHDDKWFSVQIFDTSTSSISDICFTVPFWNNTNEMIQTLARYIYAVGDGYTDEEYIVRELRNGIIPSRQYDFDRVKIRTNSCWEHSGNKRCDKEWD